MSRETHRPIHVPKCHLGESTTHRKYMLHASFTNVTNIKGRKPLPIRIFLSVSRKHPRKKDHNKVPIVKVRLENFFKRIYLIGERYSLARAPRRRPRIPYSSPSHQTSSLVSPNVCRMQLNYNNRDRSENIVQIQGFSALKFDKICGDSPD